MRYSNSQIEIKLNLIHHYQKKPKRSTFSEHSKRFDKKSFFPRRHQVIVIDILDQIIADVVTKSNNYNAKERLILQFIEADMETLFELQGIPKQGWLEKPDEQPVSQIKPKITSTHQESIMNNSLETVRPDVKPIVSRRQTKININIPSTKLPMLPITTQQDQYINILRQQYLKNLQIARVAKMNKLKKEKEKKEKNKNSKTKSRKHGSNDASNNSSVLMTQKMSTQIKQQDIIKEVTKQEQQSSNKLKQQQPLKIIKPRIASYSELPQQRVQFKKQVSNNSNKKTQVSQQIVHNRRKSLTAFQKQSPRRQFIVNDTVVTKQRVLNEIMKNKRMSLFIIPNKNLDKNSQASNHVLNIQKSQIKRVTEVVDKHIDIQKLINQNKRVSMPLNVFKSFNENKQKVLELLKSQLKTPTKIKKQNKQNRSSVDNNKTKALKTIRTPKHNHSPSLKKSISHQKIIQRPKGYLLTPLYNTTKNDTSISQIMYTQQTKLNTSTNQIKSKFGNEGDAQQKHQIIQLLKAIQSPTTVPLNKAYSPIPLRLQRLRKYINNNVKNKKATI